MRSAPRVPAAKLSMKMWFFVRTLSAVCKLSLDEVVVSLVCRLFLSGVLGLDAMDLLILLN